MRISIVLFSLLLFFGCSDSPKVKVETVPFTPPASDSQTVGINLQDQTDTAGILNDLGIEFGFRNEKGTQGLLISEDSIKNPLRFTKIVTITGEIADVNFIELRKPTEKDNGRQTEYNFENCGGYLYTVKTNNTFEESSLIFVTEKFLSGRKHMPSLPALPSLSVAKDNQKMKNTCLAKIQKDKDRKIKNFKILSIFSRESQICLAEFALKKDSALARLAFISEDKTIYLDFPAKFDATSTWRVDDGGEFGMDYFKVLAVFEYDGKIEIVTDWHGAEGVVTSYYREENGKFVEVKTSSRYTAPL